jgi:hypothetical protein
MRPRSAALLRLLRVSEGRELAPLNFNDPVAPEGGRVFFLGGMPFKAQIALKPLTNSWAFADLVKQCRMVLTAP